MGSRDRILSEGIEAAPTPKPASDDRPTTPPPFDVEAFARQSITMDSDHPPAAEPIASLVPPATTTPPVTLSTGPERVRPSARVGRSSMALWGVALLCIVVLGGASVMGRRRMHISAWRTSATLRATAPPPSAWVVVPPPDLPVVLSVVRTAATPSATRAIPSQVVPPSSVATGAPGCQPPYVIDGVTGKKHWKLQCL
jgi:hypothetical protein